MYPRVGNKNYDPECHPDTDNEKKPAGTFSSILFLYFCKDLQTDYGFGPSFKHGNTIL